MSEGRTCLKMADGVASIVFDRPTARNAMTWAMYDQLTAACAAIKADPALRVAVFRGAGGCFVAGTDIGQFASFSGAESGLAYEARVEACIAGLEDLPVPTLAVIEGLAMGGGLAIAAACDLRIATADARFGVPIARTVGNCLSVSNVARLVAAFGDSRTRRLLQLADSIDAHEALACGFLSECVTSEQIDACVARIVARLQSHAPITMRVSKEAVRRIRASAVINDADLIAAAYGSRDFVEGVDAFVSKRAPHWRGR
jgi:enoyl-CoA hydratase